MSQYQTYRKKKSSISWFSNTHTLISNLRLFIRKGFSIYFWITNVFISNGDFVDFKLVWAWFCSKKVYLMFEGLILDFYADWAAKLDLFWVFSKHVYFIILFISLILSMTWIPLPRFSPVGFKIQMFLP